MKLDWPKLALRWKEALGKYKYVLLVIGLGVVLMALPTTGQRDKGQEGAQAPAEGFDLEAFEEKMERALSQVEGAGEVRVVLTLDSDGQTLIFPGSTGSDTVDAYSIDTDISRWTFQ